MDIQRGLWTYLLLDIPAAKPYNMRKGEKDMDTKLEDFLIFARTDLSMAEIGWAILREKFEPTEQYPCFERWVDDQRTRPLLAACLNECATEFASRQRRSYDTTRI